MQEFLANNKIEVVEQVDAGKKKLGVTEALELASHADELIVTKGKKVIHVNLKSSRPQDAELLSLMLGPTGNLRAPTIRKGRKLFVGFEEQALNGL